MRLCKFTFFIFIPESPLQSGSLYVHVCLKPSYTVTFSTPLVELYMLLRLRVPAGIEHVTSLENENKL